jgi:hypothetical protein
MSRFKVAGIKCSSCVLKITRRLEESGFNNFEFIGSELVFSGTAPSDLESILKSAGSFSIESEKANLTPLLVVVLYILGGAILIAELSGDYSLHSMMNSFMGGFFIIFSLFKMIDLKGFVSSYASYDLLAARSKAYAYLYPFIELLLGIFYFAELFPKATNLITLFLMIFGSFGVYRALRLKQKIQCACLGATLNLPMTKVTLIENLTMGAMALFMLFK